MSNSTLVSKDNLQPEKITKGDLLKAWLRWNIYAETSHSYERLQSMTFCYAIMPILKKLYKQQDEFKQALVRHLSFFNTQGVWGGGTILGITTALEEQRAHALAEGKTEGTDPTVITSTKVGLMGPFAGIGDSIDGATVQYLGIAIALPWAKSGWWFAAVFSLLFYCTTYVYGYYFTKAGYSLGLKAAENMLKGGTVTKLIEGMSVMGLFMMGVIASTYIKLSTTLTWTISGKEFALQKILDTILPGLLPFAAVSLVYIYFVNRGLKITRMLVYMCVIFFVLGVVGVL